MKRYLSSLIISLLGLIIIVVFLTGAAAEDRASFRLITKEGDSKAMTGLYLSGGRYPAIMNVTSLSGSYSRNRGWNLLAYFKNYNNISLSQNFSVADLLRKDKSFMRGNLSDESYYMDGDYSVSARLFSKDSILKLRIKNSKEGKIRAYQLLTQDSYRTGYATVQDIQVESGRVHLLVWKREAGLSSGTQFTDYILNAATGALIDTIEVYDQPKAAADTRIDAALITESEAFNSSNYALISEIQSKLKPSQQKSGYKAKEEWSSIGWTIKAYEYATGKVVEVPAEAIPRIDQNQMSPSLHQDKLIWVNNSSGSYEGKGTVQQIDPLTGQAVESDIEMFGYSLSDNQPIYWLFKGDLIYASGLVAGVPTVIAKDSHSGKLVYHGEVQTDDPAEKQQLTETVFAIQEQ